MSLNKIQGVTGMRGLHVLISLVMKVVAFRLNAFRGEARGFDRIPPVMSHHGT
jgi:hypothetical protein